MSEQGECILKGSGNLGNWFLLLDSAVKVPLALKVFDKDRWRVLVRYLALLVVFEPLIDFQSFSFWEV